MRRLGHLNERGATAVVIALLMIVMLGFTALAVDVGVLWSDKKQLQNGADAGALAIAQQCADGACPLDPDAEAARYVDANEKDQGLTGRAGDATVTLSGNAGKVRVVGSATRPHWFAPVIGVASSNVAAAAEASWGPVGGLVTPPFAFSVCEFAKQAGLAWDGSTLPSMPTGDITILFPKTFNASDSPPCPDKDNSGNFVPGGFAWLETVDNSTCETESLVIGEDIWLPSSPGKATPSGCSPSYLEQLLSADHILIPLFSGVKLQDGSDKDAPGKNAAYKLYGFAAFKVFSYHLANSGGPDALTYCETSDPVKYPVDCTGPDRSIRGSFLKFVALEDAEINPSAPNTGAIVVKLTD